MNRIMNEGGKRGIVVGEAKRRDRQGKPRGAKKIGGRKR